MSQRTGSCRAYRSPGGCRYGDRCKFSHAQGGPATPRGSPSPMLSPTNRSRSQTPFPQAQGSPTHNRPPSGVPRGACQFFWASGACARGFECSFRHVKQAGPPSGPVDTENGGDPGSQGGQEVDFFSTEGLAVSIGSTRDDRHNLNPSDVHNHLRDFVRDKYIFNSAAQVQGFIRVLASVNEGNKSWVCHQPFDFRWNSPSHVPYVDDRTQTTPRLVTIRTTVGGVAANDVLQEFLEVVVKVRSPPFAFTYDAHSTSLGQCASSHRRSSAL